MFKQESKSKSKNKRFYDICQQLDERKINREKRLEDAKNSVKEFINNTVMDTSIIDKKIKGRIDDMVEEGYQRY